MGEQILEPGDYTLVRELSLLVRRRVAGTMTGEQRSPSRGGGIEFADYREYMPGDDVRHLDWSVYLRFRRLMVKLCAEEKELTLMLLIDTSKSMSDGSPEKMRLARRVAAILAGMSLHGGNRVGVLSLGGRQRTGLHEILAPQRSQLAFSTLVRVIQDIPPSDRSDPVLSIREFASRYGRRCIGILLSDLLYPGWPEVLRGLGASGSEAGVIHILSPHELVPEQTGETGLVDMEDGSEVSVHIDREMIESYARRLKAYLSDVRQLCHGQGLSYSLVSSDQTLRRIFHEDLRTGGLVC